MNTIWNKTNLVLIMIDENDKKIRYTYNNLIEKPSDDQITKFAAVIEKLTGMSFFTAYVTTTDNKTQAA
ncbi:hypothetical protein [Secundilactobacillus mixtipabuli]|uniref:DUF1659 domain-containing protein n=1 Tax=Secundilactobacillus mixtipabuli TaxID=1435342 RepID=A0A1Z5I9D7_9LACO|nr:hypothetical protein [Secundilactobacillus mixtipabuli]GAW98221.1 hypothetical protein IWT30_00164 [Secundilactobacillus mixtipabuli]